jgi:polyisoprenoid-binding protein YceI
MNTKKTWKIDPTHSEIGFKVKHMMISTVSGYFNEYDATIETADENFIDADISFSAKTSSINTKENDRDKHLRSPDFFDSEKYPELSFKSESFNGDTLKGVLTIKDVSRNVSLDVDFNGIATDPYGQTKAGFEVRGTINRKDFNLTWNALTEAGNIVVGDKVKILLDLQFTKS